MVQLPRELLDAVLRYLPLIATTVIYAIWLYGPAQFPDFAIVDVAEDTRRELILKAYAHYNDNNYRTVGFLLVFIGWLVTSKAARDFVIEHAVVQWIFRVALVAFYFLHALLLQNISTNIRELLPSTMQLSVADISYPENWVYPMLCIGAYILASEKWNQTNASNC